MNEIRKDILDKIKKGEIKKTSQFYFMVKNYFFWFLFVFSILIGSLAVSSSLVRIFFDLPAFEHIYEGGTEYFFLVLPYLWILILALFATSAWFNYKHTKKAYKKHNFLIVAGAIISSLVLGSLLFATGAGEVLEHQMQKNFPVYKKDFEERVERRVQIIEERGLQGGMLRKKLEYLKENGVLLPKEFMNEIREACSGHGCMGSEVLR
jgi:hypothetical protein